MKKMIILFALIILSACCGFNKISAEKPPVTETPAIQACPEKRSQMCTKIYAPVCATRDTGIRCVTAPCPSTENKTYGNSCTACADEKVLGYIPGACTAEKKQD